MEKKKIQKTEEEISDEIKQTLFEEIKNTINDEIGNVKSYFYLCKKLHIHLVIFSFLFCFTLLKYR